MHKIIEERLDTLEKNWNAVNDSLHELEPLVRSHRSHVRNASMQNSVFDELFEHLIDVTRETLECLIHDEFGYIGKFIGEDCNFGEYAEVAEFENNTITMRNRGLLHDCIRLSIIEECEYSDD